MRQSRPNQVNDPGRTMNRHLKVATVVVVALAVAPTTQALAAPPKTSLCGALARTRVYAIEADVVRCAEARRVAQAHERSVARNGACRPGPGTCVAARFNCIYPFGTTAPMRVLCGSRGDRKVTFFYRAKRG
jgi:hypothetical protein